MKTFPLDPLLLFKSFELPKFLFQQNLTILSPAQNKQLQKELKQKRKEAVKYLHHHCEEINLIINFIFQHLLSNLTQQDEILIEKQPEMKCNMCSGWQRHQQQQFKQLQLILKCLAEEMICSLGRIQNTKN